MSDVLGITLDLEGALLRLRLNRPKANIVDAEMIAALEAAFAAHQNDRDLAAVLVEAEGPHFSFGASVEEHLPASCEEMLKSLHALVRRMLEFPVPVLVAVRGQCLGGGLEVAMAGHMIFAAPEANLGQPEMMLGVFAPAASCLMPGRVGQARAEDLLYSGRSVSGSEAFAMGLVDAVAEDPEAAVIAYVENHLKPKSTSSLRMAVRAARAGYCREVIARLDEVENLYLNDLMSTQDAVEGLEAFIAKRPAKWENR
ncbi:MAG: cyclohexa-1,5-dienecarbonyl-CoA hydratase [Roseibium sp.]|uniref:cyclohexa-1,5-dienecarbonyl-CoA hydratase n=1 Tax=Roseibium sp. TaxID=1936156 RepID=UPI00263663EB|nr:cyclohexa-1,5-dienecarbonyl-CoA hydratase [Roseibium sp.]MCV0426123.1 cyclohexa-1,5-dienecarbonyl-CoA hydratase [Roseibium sp.]